MIVKSQQNTIVLVTKPHLPSRAFGPVRINRVFMENNKMMTVDRNALAGVEEFLTEIYIKEPLLKSLPSDAVDFLKRLEVLSIEDSQVWPQTKFFSVSS